MDETQNTQAPQEPKKSSYNTMALISYIGPLCLIPFFKKEQDEFAKFHMKQGMVIFAGELITWIIVAILPLLWFLGNLVGLVWLVLGIIGIMNVIKNEKKEIPIVGKFADKIKL
ncbi:MAG: DUF4870 domain-containing protein [Patescibacteria group bacterium]